MNKKFMSILRIHEKDDMELTACQDRILKIINTEFKNSEEIIAAAKNNNYECIDFFKSEDFPLDWPVVPIRTATEFSIRKLTMSQRPYYHDHDFYEMLYVYRGKCLQSFRNPDSSLRLDKGKICLLRPGSVHAIERCGLTDAVLKLCIPRELYEELSANLIEWKGDDKFKVFDISENVEYIVFKLLEESAASNMYADKARKSYLELLFIELLRYPVNIDRDFDAQLNNYLTENIKDAALSDFARELGYSTGYLGRLIKNKTGKSFTEILGAFRLKSAANILKSTDVSIDDIAYEIGYANPSGLYKQFCGHYGMTPNAYRKLFR